MFREVRAKISFSNFDLILRWILEASWKAFWDSFGRLLGSLWEAFGPLGAHLGGPWALLGTTSEGLGLSWAPFWSFLVPLGVSLEEIGAFYADLEVCVCIFHDF